MKKCKYTESNVIEYVICIMSREDETKFQYHLLKCGNCRNKVDGYRKLRNEFIKIFESEK